MSNPRQPQQPKKQRKIPSWERQSPFLAEIASIEAFDILTVDMGDPQRVSAAVDAWAQLEPEVKDYLLARIQLNTLIGLDHVRRRTDRNGGYLESVRTGVRLTVQKLKELNDAMGYIEEADYEDEDEAPAPRRRGLGGVQIDQGDHPDGMDEQELEMAGLADEAFSALDQNPGHGYAPDVDGREQHDLPDSVPTPTPEAHPKGATPAPKTKRKRVKKVPSKKAPAKKAPAKKAAPASNGAGTPEVLDGDGNTITPEQPGA